ncbi:MAG TPA: LuxR C-terminal-related transcriptional regulator [Amycolatopsis sp.]|nr:LuxR C-terminal-related transcriptional regulator [Amycolatopsis sp.]
MAKSTRGRQGSLPADLTSMVGRRAESAEIKRMLSGSRLVTLTGTGGVGKTRLALHVARQLHPAFRDGVWLVPLGELTQPDLLPLTVMSVISRQSGSAGTGVAELSDFVGDRQLLLVLDNCEHLIEACAKLTTDLLRSCPNLKVLATSREQLRIEGEVLFEVPPLAVPTNGDAAALASRYDAVRLFVERASSVCAGFSLTPEQERAVCALCRRLDGLPLAIELAALRSRALSIDELLARQNDRFDVLTAGSRTAPLRHRTLRAVVDYSYQLCSPELQRLWARISVFAGGADLNAVEAVCTGPGLTAAGIPQALAELVDKSIVTFDGSRYRMLETIRAYGLERLRQFGEQRRAGLAHCDYFARLAEDLAAGSFGPDQAALLGRALADHANLRIALEFCLTQPGQATVGLRIAGLLWHFWAGCGLQVEGQHWLDRLLAAGTEPTRERVRALWINAWLAVTRGDIPTGLPLLDECDELAAALGDEDGTAHATFVRGLAEGFLGRPEHSIARLEEAVRLGRLLPAGGPLLAEALIHLGATLCYEKRLDRAVEVLEEGRRLCTEHSEQWLLSWFEVLLGLAAQLGGRQAQATILLNQGLARKHAVGDLLGISIALEFLGWVAIDSNDTDRGVRLIGASQSLAEPLGAHLVGYPRLLDWHGDYSRQARDSLGPRAFDKALEYGRNLGKDRAVAYASGKAMDVGPAPPASREDLPLTRREREVAELVATGKTNRQIAGELVIAVRTVDTHVENILTKLGFTSRAQIAALLARRAGSPDGGAP